VLKPGGIVCYTNRTDKLDQWAAAEQKLTDEKSWELVERSERIPYLPFNQEFGKDTEIVISTWRKTFESALSHTQDKKEPMKTTLGFVCKEEAKAREDMFNQDRKDLVSCMWYDELQRSRGNVPLLQLNDQINILLDKKAIPKTWGKPATGPTFNSKYPIEFRKSQIECAGNGAFALVDIPQGTRLRRVAVADGTLVRFCNEQELMMAGWDIDDTVNYGIGHFRDPSSIYFLNPGTAMNHADKTREPSVKYVHDEEGALELWTVKDIKAGQEMFNHYHKDFAPCMWYDELQRSRGNVPLSQLNDHINALYDKNLALLLNYQCFV